MVAGCSSERGSPDPTPGSDVSTARQANVRMQTAGTASGSQAAAAAIMPGSRSAPPSCSPAQDNAAHVAESGSSSLQSCTENSQHQVSARLCRCVCPQYDAVQA